jgi:hypothetical protein
VPLFLLLVLGSPSQNYRSVQLADLLAGSIISTTNTSRTDGNTVTITHLIIHQLTILNTVGNHQIREPDIICPGHQPNIRIATITLTNRAPIIEAEIDD